MSLIDFLSRARTAALPAGALVAAVFAFGASAQEDQVAQAPGAPPPPAQSMHPGMRPGMHGPREGDRCARMAEHLDRINKNLSPEQVRDIIAGRLAQSGMNTLKVGKVHTTGEGAVAVDITTTSGSLVATREISPKTGLPADLVKRCEAMKARMTAAHAGQPGGDDHDGHGDGPMGHRWMERGHFGDGPMMGGGMGGMPERGGLALISNVGPGRDLNLTADQARKLADAELVRLGNARLKVGTVKEKDADTMAVDIVTSDNALVLREEIDRHNGHIKRAG